MNRRGNSGGSFSDGYFAVFFQLVKPLFHARELFLDLFQTLRICARSALRILREQFEADESENGDTDQQNYGNEQTRPRLRRWW